MAKDKLDTIAVHAGTHEPESVTRSKVAPIFATSVWSFDRLSLIDDIYEQREPGFVYSRMANPTVQQLEQVVSRLDGAGGAIAYASGMAAIAVALLAELKQGDHVVAHHVLYGGTYALLKNELPKLGITTTFIDFNDLDAVKKAVQPQTRVLYAETICNPLMEVVDIPAIVAIAKKSGAKVYVDNTFATPIICRPLGHGADVVLYSATKYLNGHSDVTAGVIVSDAAFIGKARAVGTIYGPTLSPFDAWLTIRGLRTLPLRLERQSQNALALAKFLAGHPKVTRVNYPGLDSSPTRTIADRILTGDYGGMLSFTVVGDDLAGARTVIDGLEMTELVPSLAGLATTTSHPGKTSHRAIPVAERSAYGVGDGLIRVSVGIEGIEDIIADFDQALAKV